MCKSMLLCVFLLARPLSGAEAESSQLSGESCMVLGQGGLRHWQSCAGLEAGQHDTTSVHVPVEGKMTWACTIPEFGVALCDEEKSTLRLWRQNSSSFVDVTLGPLTAPVGAVHLAGKVYVACFGSWPAPKGDSGLAVVDVSSGRLEAVYPYSGDPDAHLHNVYAFDWQGKQEIFVAVLGNPWTEVPLPGDGLVRFDRDDGSFLKESTAAPLSARSAVQQSDGVIYVLTQEPSGKQTRLARLEAQGDVLVVTAETELPSRNGGDGGADVFLGRDLDSVFCTDRTSGGGKLYYYTYTAAMLRGLSKQAQLQSGSFELLATHNTGANPRHSVHLPSSGNVIVCNQDDATLTVFVGLAKEPTSSNSVQLTVPTHPVIQSSFFLKV
eukprot:TRINITY_DN97033_c0_g1_i1.p1 TRINITY_DN97033_c0_g1~~TRINITY_DN97033_c0_g1_i1.p1  ORF type:complete len:382 (-),score=74.73 TRINITY_DN97033_c0_g1_i1:33-1178(-)